MTLNLTLKKPIRRINSMENIVKESTRYDDFKFMAANRVQARGHVEVLKKAFNEVGNLTMVQPILVNDRMEIIDGQHRFLACKELGLPIYYTQVPGLSVHEARSMNILHRGWNADDYAHSYAASGDPSYQRYLEIKEQYEVSNSVMITLLPSLANRKRPYKHFRSGEMVIDETDEAILLDRLDKLAEIGEFTPMAKYRTFVRAFVKIVDNPNYNHRQMLRKIRLNGERVLKRFSSLEDTLRNLEEVYNYGQSENRRVRLY